MGWQSDLMVTGLCTSTKLPYVSSPDGTEMGHCLQVYHLDMNPGSAYIRSIFHDNQGLHFKRFSWSQKPTGSRTNIKDGANVHSHRERVWPGGVMAKALASDTRVCELNSRPFRCQVPTLGKLFTHMCLCHKAV